MPRAASPTAAGAAERLRRWPFVLGGVVVAIGVLVVVLVGPDILIEQPRIAAAQAEDGSANYLFSGFSSGGNSAGAKLGNLRITGGQIHVVLARLRADFNVVMETRDTNDKPQVEQRRRAPMRGYRSMFFVGGTLLSLRDAAMPYPVDLKLENGPTRASLVGTVENSPMRSNGLAKNSARDFWKLGPKNEPKTQST